MLTLLEEIPEVIQRYLDRYCNGGTAEGFSKKVFKADSGWCLIYRYGDACGYNVYFFGESLTFYPDQPPRIYINKDALDAGTDAEYYETILYGYHDDYDPSHFYRCDTTYSKTDMKTWIEDEFRHQPTSVNSFDKQEAIEEFLNMVSECSYTGSSIIQDMMEDHIYPFNLIKQVHWLN